MPRHQNAEITFDSLISSSLDLARSGGSSFAMCSLRLSLHYYYLYVCVSAVQKKIIAACFGGNSYKPPQVILWDISLGSAFLFLLNSVI